jgi:uncharacterized tellurite resistance protein B-like protein
VSSNQEVMMIGALKAFLLQVFENARSEEQLENKDCRLATAALLVRVATVNGEMSQARGGKLHAVLKSGFGLNYLTTNKLIDGAAAAERSRSISTTSPVSSMKFSMTKVAAKSLK